MCVRENKKQTVILQDNRKELYMLSKWEQWQMCSEYCCSNNEYANKYFEKNEVLFKNKTLCLYV